MNNFVGGITGPPQLFAADNSPPNSVTTSSVTRHKKVFLKKLKRCLFLTADLLFWRNEVRCTDSLCEPRQACSLQGYK